MVKFGGSCRCAHPTAVLATGPLYSGLGPSGLDR